MFLKLMSLKPQHLINIVTIQLTIIKRNHLRYFPYQSCFYCSVAQIHHNIQCKVKALSLKKKHEDSERLKKKHTYSKYPVCTASIKPISISFTRYGIPENVSIDDLVKAQVGESASSNVCHHPHATFLSLQPSNWTCVGMFRSIVSPRPSC